MVEGRVGGEVVDENSAGGATVVGARDGAETFSAGSIPELIGSEGGQLASDIEKGGEKGGGVALLTCNFIRFLLAPVPTLIILVANSTPMVWDDRTLHSLLTKRCSRHDLCGGGN